MLTIAFFIALIWVTIKLLILGIKAAWGIAKVLSVLILFPLLLVGLLYLGLIYVAIPILLVALVITIIGGSVMALCNGRNER